MFTNCGDGHMPGRNNCEIEIKERLIKKLQANRRVGRQRALQISAGEDESPRSDHQSYPTHFSCEIDPEKQRKINLWAI